MANRIVLLGTGTCQLQTHRMASSVLVEIDDLRLVYDLGRGVTLRLVELGLRQDDLEHIVLSHFHPDHLSDLVAYLQAGAWSQIDPRNKDLHKFRLPRGAIFSPPAAVLPFKWQMNPRFHWDIFPFSSCIWVKRFF